MNAKNEIQTQTTIERHLQSLLRKDYLKKLERGAGLTRPMDFYAALEDIPNNDLDAGRLMKSIFHDTLTYIPTSASKGDWYFWNGAIHEKHDLGLIDDFLTIGLADYLRDYARQLTEDAKKLITEEDRKAVEGGINALRKYASMIRSAQPMRNLRSRICLAFTRTRDHFDNDAQWVVLANGEVQDLSKLDGDLLPADPSRPVSRALGVSYHPNAPFPTKWVESLNQWVPDKGVQKYLQVAAGAALLGKGDAKNIVALVGVSNTGKSTYLNILKEVFGGYAGALPATAIVQKYGGASNFEQAKARGKRFLYLSEPQKQRTDDSFLKNLSGGGETIMTAEKGKDAVEWQAQCVLHIAANHVPEFDTQDNAIVERMNLVGFDHVFPRDASGSADTFAKDVVAEEGSAIFLWIVEGAAIYKELGYIPVPEAIRAKSKGNVVEASAPLRWLNEVIGDGHYHRVPGAPMASFEKPVDLYPQFVTWCLSSGEKKVVSQKTWLAEIERFNEMPADKKGKRSQGFARVYGVVSESTFRTLPQGQGAAFAPSGKGMKWSVAAKSAEEV